jgi:hypothetical protein
LPCVHRLTNTAHQAIERVGEKAEALYGMPQN